MSNHVLSCRSHLLFVAMAAALLPSCMAVVSKHPLGDPNQAKPDLQLLGKWCLEDKGTRLVLEIEKCDRKAMPPGTMTVSAFLNDRPMKFDFFVTKLGDQSFASLTPVPAEVGKNDEVMKDHYCFATYSMSGDDLMIALMKPEAVAEAIKQIRVKGEAWQDSGGPLAVLGGSASLNDTTENLQKFVRGQDRKALFEDLIPFKRSADNKTSKWTFDSKKALANWTTTGDVTIDRTKAVTARGFAQGRPRRQSPVETSGQGRVGQGRVLGLRRRHHPGKRQGMRVGPRWGLVQSDGRCWPCGILYASYLGGDEATPPPPATASEWFDQLFWLG